MYICICIFVCNDVAVVTSAQWWKKNRPQQQQQQQQHASSTSETELYPTVRYNIFLTKIHRTFNISIYMCEHRNYIGQHELQGNVMKSKEMENKNDTVVNVLQRIKWLSRPIYVFALCVCIFVASFGVSAQILPRDLVYSEKKQIEKLQQLIQYWFVNFLNADIRSFLSWTIYFLHQFPYDAHSFRQQSTMNVKYRCVQMLWWIKSILNSNVKFYAQKNEQI